MPLFVLKSLKKIHHHDLRSYIRFHQFPRKTTFRKDPDIELFNVISFYLLNV